MRTLPQANAPQRGLRLQLQPSRLQWWWLLASSLFALGCWSLVPLPLAVSVIGVITICGAALWQLRKPAVITGIRFSGDSGWSIKIENQPWRPVALNHPVFISTWAVGLSFTDSSNSRHRCCVFADAVSANQHRTLRVLLTTLKPAMADAA